MNLSSILNPELPSVDINIFLIDFILTKHLHFACNTDGEKLLKAYSYFPNSFLRKY